MFGATALTTAGDETVSRDAAKYSVQSLEINVGEGRPNVVFVWWRQFGGEHNSGSATLNSSVFGSSIVDFFGVEFY